MDGDLNAAVGSTILGGYVYKVKYILPNQETESRGWALPWEVADSQREREETKVGARESQMVGSSLPPSPLPPPPSRLSSPPLHRGAEKGHRGGHGQLPGIAHPLVAGTWSRTPGTLFHPHPERVRSPQTCLEWVWSCTA